MADVLFDNAPEVVAVALESSGVDLSGCEVTLVRDLLGRVRVYVEYPPNWPTDEAQKLSDSLISAAPYTVSPVIVDALTVTADKARMPLVGDLRAQRRPLATAPASARAKWFIYERRFSKDSWLTETQKPVEPWAFSSASPRVISFYGFKGGVGRTTAMSAFALYLSSRGKNVVIVDLDLEAPGAAPMLATEEMDLGVVDFLLEARVTRATPLALSRYYVPSPFAPGPGSISVIPAGNLDDNYLEKLGRIDVQGLTDPTHAVRTLLFSLVSRVRTEMNPDAILLDVRAGLHDLGGASLSGLSHLELVFAENTPQTWAGLPVVLRHLGRLRADWVKLVHTMVPPRRRADAFDISADFRRRAYDLCSNEYYVEGDVPGPQDTSATHYAYELPFREALLGVLDLTVGTQLLLSDEHKSFCVQLAKDLDLEDAI
ncbi:KGGVGR-motif variant AAA ATPase [Anaeromyxobacter diazotrophicus]|uniref:AAA domain-containing protein n=1 Tax=Anaeromyxobacter diazotrophicus TaxID=2590199 RepID=A0A7I9VNH2_9BACT|nr:AAA family ATPase [Anaeromyxobacter diazotrophicus]GEJ57527.1 hypothetical protein AMYX_22680 [Anaeromyxobacter diazotrophicus]